MRSSDSDEGGGVLPSQDSFLDIVSNIVGILVLLVMVVSLRAAQGDRGSRVGRDSDAATDPGPRQAVVEAALRDALTTRQDAAEKLSKAAAAAREVALRDAERLELATFLAAVREEIEQKRAEMTDDRRRDFDLRAKIGAARHELEALTRERIALIPDDPKPIEVQSLPTPMAKTVRGREVQVRLAGGRVRVIPWESLNELARAKAEAELWRLDSRDRMTITVGPVDGFRVKYLVEKKTVATRQGMITQVGSVGQVLLPGDERQGETVEQALRAGSALMRSVAGESRGRKPTVTVWTYPDSFDGFRKIKASLFDRGYAVAARPMPTGAPIARSPRGTKSSAQ